MIKPYLGFLRAGFLGFGGGIAMLPYLEEIAREYAQIESAEFLQIVTLAQTFPGAMGINAAGIIGYRMGKWKGAAAAVLLLLIPCMFYAALLFYAVGFLRQTTWFPLALKVLKASLIGIILGMVLNLGRGNVTDVKALLLAIGSLAAFFIFKMNPAWILLIAGVLGWLILQPPEKAGRNE